MLPSINTLPIHEIELKVLNKKIKYSPFTVEQEKNILMALESEAINDLINNYIQVLNICVQDELDWDSLSIVDFINLIINIRSKSKGENLELQKKCEKCGKNFDQTVLIEDVLKYKNENNLKDTIKINEELTLELKPLSHKFLYDLDTLKEEISLYIHTAAYSISKLMFKGKIYKIDDVEELKEKILSKLTYKHLNDIFKKCSNFVTLYLSVEFKCPHCGEMEVVDVDNALKLLK